MRSYNLPLMILGGGGYTVKNVARAWTFETAVAIGCEKDLMDQREIPVNEYLDWYGPEFKMEVKSGNMENLNGRAELEGMV
jgi:histone deacetylase 1/2